jgi:hypothetical protein
MSVAVKYPLAYPRTKQSLSNPEAPPVESDPCGDQARPPESTETDGQLTRGRPLSAAAFPNKYSGRKAKRPEENAPRTNRQPRLTAGHSRPGVPGTGTGRAQQTADGAAE